MKIHPLPFVLLASTALGCTIAVPLSAQTPPAATPAPATPAPTAQAVPTQLDAVTTAATRTRRPLDDVAATVSVITSEDIDRENMQDIRDLTRNEPGVTVGNNPTRAGFQNFLIRGIGGNRVLLMLDGMRLPDFPDSNMGAGTYTREHPDLEDIKQVEIIRGPASALYGSDAIGGVVAYTTKDPGDYLINGQAMSTAASRAPTAAPTSTSPRPSPAPFAPSNVEFLGIYTRRDGGANSSRRRLLARAQPHELGRQRLPGQARAPADRRTTRSASSASYNQGQQNTQVLSNVGDFPAPGRQDLSTNGAATTTQRSRISAQWLHDAPIGFIDRIDFLAYFNSTITPGRYLSAARRPTTASIPNNYRFSSFWLHPEHLRRRAADATPRPSCSTCRTTSPTACRFSYTTRPGRVTARRSR